jgi:hypothetical protein
MMRFLMPSVAISTTLRMTALMRAHTPAEALCSVSAKTKAQFGQPTRRSKGS